MKSRHAVLNALLTGIAEDAEIIKGIVEGANDLSDKNLQSITAAAERILANVGRYDKENK